MTSILQKVVAASGFTSISPTAGPIPLPTTGKIRVILADDDDRFRSMVAAELGDQGFEVTDFADGASLLRHLAEGNSADIGILDWRMPSMNGLELLDRIRRQGSVLPAIFLTGMPEKAFEATALDRGAVDFVDKSRGADILIRRIRRAVEAGGLQVKTDDADLTRGRLNLRAKVRRAYWDGVDVGLTVTEYNIIHRLAGDAGEYIGYRDLYDCVHRQGFVAGAGENGYRTNVRSSMRRIRDKFRAIDPVFEEIENFPSFGYRWRSQPGELTAAGGVQAELGGDGDHVADAIGRSA